MSVTAELRGDIAGVARMWRLSRQAVTRRIEREAAKSGAREVRFDGIRAVRKGSRCWIVYIGAKWLAGGKYQQWAPLDVFATERGLSPKALKALREGLRQSATRDGDGVESTFEGLRARKLGVRWMVCLGGWLP
jgi:hypothetical protein